MCFERQPTNTMKNQPENPSPLAAAITRVASKQTYYTVKFLVDRDLINRAYQAYAYFRWVDDYLDADHISRTDRLSFASQQVNLMKQLYTGHSPTGLSPEERMLANLIHQDPCPNGGLKIYINSMMDVMTFDADRRGRWISQAELVTYTHSLAAAVTEALHYFIGHSCLTPRTEARYHAAIGAHITHMLRDTYDDLEAGYFNIPQEVLTTHRITPQDIQSKAYRTWVRSRVELARAYFEAGKRVLATVENIRRRLAGYAYIARFEWVLDVIEAEGYLLRPNYVERKNPAAGAKMAWSMFSMEYKTRESRQEPFAPIGKSIHPGEGKL